jgi:nitrogen regulatory protein PII
MRKIEAVIRTIKLERVNDALVAAGVVGMSVTEVYGHGHQPPRTITYRGVDDTRGLVPRVKIETVVSEDQVDALIDAIYENGHTGEVGDGLIFVTDLESAIGIRTGESERAEDHLVDSARR